MRRLLAPIALVPLLLPAVPATAQEPEAAVRLILVSQSLFGSPDRPLKLKLRAANQTPERFEDLSISVWFYPPVRSRSEYGQSLEFDAPTALDIKRFEVAGGLDPGESKVIRVETVLGELTARAENALYPMRVLLESAFVPIAVLRSPLVFIQENPKVPLSVGLSVVLDAPVRLLPDGAFSESALEEEIAPDGPLEVLVAALEAVPVDATLVVSPLLLIQLERMAGGYEVRTGTEVRRVPTDGPGANAASALLTRIQALARDPNTEVVALPFASPSIPAMAEGALQADLDRQIRRGAFEVERILGIEPIVDLIRPPGSALTGPALGALADLGVENLLVDAATLPPAPGFRLTPPPLGELGGGAGRRLTAVTPDPGVASRLLAPPGNAALRAQWALGELSMIYLEAPNEDRGAAVVIGGEEVPELTFLKSLLGGIGAVPPQAQWLRPVKVSRLLALDAHGERRLRPTRETYSGQFLSELAEARERMGQFVATAPESTGVAGRLATLLLIAEHRGFLADQAQAIEYLDAIDGLVAQEFAKIDLPPMNSVTTLASQGGAIPVTIRSEADYDMHVVIGLRSSQLEFLGGQTRDVVLSEPAQPLTFPVRALTRGRFQVLLEVRTPDGDLITDSRIVVRSTAYNIVALVVTVGAALFLAALWARRFLPRRS